MLNQLTGDKATAAARQKALVPVTRSGRGAQDVPNQHTAGKSAAAWQKVLVLVTSSGQ